MLQYICEVCHKIKGEGEAWFLGFDVQTEGQRAVTRSLVFADNWDENRAHEWTAIHLCSEACKQKYLKLTRAA
ncbi:MAG: hypothetical protein L0Z53_05585 [Acidobacteriales bacterium]|nr:hypothetical protein [Terriglobales bacterium]